MTTDDLPLTNRQVVRRYEGGTVSTAEQGDDFLVITDETALADFLDPGVDGDLLGALVAVHRFASAEERLHFLDTRYPA